MVDGLAFENNQTTCGQKHGDDFFYFFQRVCHGWKNHRGTRFSPAFLCVSLIARRATGSVIHFKTCRAFDGKGHVVRSNQRLPALSDGGPKEDQYQNTKTEHKDLGGQLGTYEADVGNGVG